MPLVLAWGTGGTDADSAAVFVDHRGITVWWSYGFQLNCTWTVSPSLEIPHTSTPSTSDWLRHLVIQEWYNVVHSSKRVPYGGATAILG